MTIEDGGASTYSYFRPKTWVKPDFTIDKRATNFHNNIYYVSAFSSCFAAPITAGYMGEPAYLLGSFVGPVVGLLPSYLPNQANKYLHKKAITEIMTKETPDSRALNALVHDGFEGSCFAYCPSKRKGIQTLVKKVGAATEHLNKTDNEGFTLLERTTCMWDRYESNKNLGLLIDAGADPLIKEGAAFFQVMAQGDAAHRMRILFKKSPKISKELSKMLTMQCDSYGSFKVLEKKAGVTLDMIKEAEQNLSQVVAVEPLSKEKQRWTKQLSNLQDIIRSDNYERK